jgi:acyl carrier protein
MQQDDVETVFAEILRRVAHIDPTIIGCDSRLREDLGIDSLSLIDVAVAAEDAFAVLIPDEDIERFQTVRDAVEGIRLARATA